MSARLGSAMLALWLVASAAHTSVAHAQDASEEERTHLVVSAQEARDSGDHARALTLARTASEIRMSTSLRLFIAQQEALSGDALGAIGEARQCVREADADAELNHRERILETCRALVAELEGQLARVSIALLGAPTGARVSLDGVAVAPADFDRIDRSPGSLQVRVAAPGYAPFEETFELAVGVLRVIEVTLQPAETADGQPAEGSASVRAPATSPSGASPAWVALPASLAVALGVASAITGALTLDARSRYDAIAAEAPSEQRSLRAADLAAEGRALRDATNVLWITAAAAGVAALITALVVDWGGGGQTARLDGRVRF